MAKDLVLRIVLDVKLDADRLQVVLDDLRFSFRELRKKPSLAVTAIISLTLGIGATTAVFSVIYGLLVNPYPYQGADRMIHLNVLNARGERRWVGITGPQLRLLRQAHCIESAAARTSIGSLRMVFPLLC